MVTFLIITLLAVIVYLSWKNYFKSEDLKLIEKVRQRELRFYQNQKKTLSEGYHKALREVKKSHEFEIKRLNDILRNHDDDTIESLIKESPDVI